VNSKQLDEAAKRYDPAADDYDLAKDPRCLWGWGPPDCDCVFGHACFRAFGHPGKCGETQMSPLPCDRRQRPKDWDATGREEANR
jgi:hypothetical protein